MNKPKYNSNLSKQPDHKKSEHISNPTLYSSIVETEFKLRNISLSHLEPKSKTKKVMFHLYKSLIKIVFNCIYCLGRE